MLVLLDMVIRASELCRLDIGDVILEEGEVRVLTYSTGNKTKPRTVFLGVRSYEALWRYLVDRVPYHDDHPLFVSTTKKRMNRNSLRHMLNHLGKRAGVDNVYPHRFRHTFAIEYLRNDDDIFTLKRLLGHSTLTMVQNYLAIAKSDVQSVHRKASPVDIIIP
jgi:integrase/recombinase XerD